MMGSAGEKMIEFNIDTSRLSAAAKELEAVPQRMKAGIARALNEVGVHRVSSDTRNCPPHCLAKNVTGQVPRRSWGIATESARCRAWRGRSAWARDARSYRRLRSATERPAEVRRDGFSTSSVQSRDGIASTRSECSHSVRSRYRCSSGSGIALTAHRFGMH
jgi:hypothetical protein